MSTYELGDIAIVTTQKGHKFVAIYTLATGIDYFWLPVLKQPRLNLFRDPEVSFKVIGKAV